MPIIELEIQIKADINIVFDLARSIDLHKISTQQTNEEAISGRTSGLIELNEFVTWRARHLGVTQTLTSKITQFEAPYSFTDEMTQGVFQKIKHQHTFTTNEHGTLMTDYFEFESPLGLLGKLANKLFITNYLERLLVSRNACIKEFAESDKWKEVLPNSISSTSN